jgi:hypothetical protein
MKFKDLIYSYFETQLFALINKGFLTKWALIMNLITPKSACLWTVFRRLFQVWDDIYYRLLLFKRLMNATHIKLWFSLIIDYLAFSLIT